MTYDWTIGRNQHYGIMKTSAMLKTVLFCLACGVMAMAEFRQNYFHVDRRYRNVLPTSGTLWTIADASQATCAQACFLEPTCTSFFYSNSQCIGCTIRMDDESVTLPLVDGYYYELKGIQGNVAVGKPAMQSSIFPLGVGSYAASQAVDGQRIAVPFGVGSSCACTNNDVHKWWMVDLRATYLVTDVAVLKRNDDILGMTLIDVTVSVGQTPGGPFSLCYNTGTVVSHTRFPTCPCQTNVIGRYVKLTMSVRTGYLCVCEVEVYVMSR